MKRQTFIVILSSFLYLSLVVTQSKALAPTMTTKEFLNYEILDTVIDSQSITISGWAFIKKNQHFRSQLDHEIALEFISTDNTFIVNTTLTNISMTSSFLYAGLSYCAENLYFKSTCNYYFEYVGFIAVIPLSNFRKGIRYSTNIIVNAKSSKTYLKTPLYYPMENSVQLKIGDYLYSIVSTLEDTNFRVLDTPIYARNGPSKTATIWALGTNCSTTHTNKLYFKLNSVYTNVIARSKSNNQTYYQVKAKLDACVDTRRRIIEGTSITPVWISGIFVEYSGSPLKINSELINQKPTLQVSNFEVIAGNSVNLLDYAKSFDPEEGNLTNKIIIESSTYRDLPGLYSVTYYVQDKYGYFDRTTVLVTVIGLNNHVPSIYAYDKTIIQYSFSNVMNEVTAHDDEDGDLTSSIITINQINTSVVGDHNVCYSVEDSKRASVTKCIIVSVISNISNQNRFRYVSKNNLFYHEAIPNQWISRVNQLMTLLNDKIVLKTVHIE